MATSTSCISTHPAGGYSLTLDNSALKDFRWCPRRGQHGNIDWIIPRTGTKFGPSTTPDMPQEIAFGVCIHSALDLWWRGGSLKEVEARFTAEYAPYATMGDKRRTMSTGLALLRTYNAAWVLDRETKYSLLATEMVFKHFLGKWVSPTGNKWRFYYTGRIDKTLREKESNRLVILDHKTTSTANSDVSRTYQIDRGFLGYLWAIGKTWAEIPAGIIADQWVVSTNGVSPQRETVPYIRERQKEWKSGVLETFRWIAERAERLLIDKEEDAFPQTGPPACMAYFRPCPYIPLCENPKNRTRLARTQYQPRGKNHLEI